MWIHSQLEISEVNGPGRRAVLWVSGCPLKCPGCFNPKTHAPNTGTWYSPRALVDQVRALSGIEGITVSGGEALMQDRELLEFLQLVKTESALSVVVYSGFTMREIRRRLKRNQTEALWGLIDILKTGRYRAGRPTRAPLRGSANQRLHFLTNRYRWSDLSPKGFEVTIAADGTLVMTGFPPKSTLRL